MTGAVQLGARGKKVLGHPALATVASQPERIGELLLARRRGGEQFLYPRHHAQRRRVPEPVNPCPPLDQQAGHLPAPVPNPRHQAGLPPAIEARVASISAPPSINARATSTSSQAGMDGFRFHDLRHTGQTLAASTGATRGCYSWPIGLE
jgi:hypothetical protein